MEVVTDAVIRHDLAFVAKEIGWMRCVSASGWLMTFLLAHTLCSDDFACPYECARSSCTTLSHPADRLL